jgi:hypothetical protein
VSPSPSRNSSPEEKRALRGLWQAKGEVSSIRGHTDALRSRGLHKVTTTAQQGFVGTDAITIIPQDFDLAAHMTHSDDSAQSVWINTLESYAIVITPRANFQSTHIRES